MIFHPAPGSYTYERTALVNPPIYRLLKDRCSMMGTETVGSDDPHQRIYMAFGVDNMRIYFSFDRGTTLEDAAAEIEHIAQRTGDFSLSIELAEALNAD